MVEIPTKWPTADGNEVWFKELRNAMNMPFAKDVCGVHGRTGEIRPLPHLDAKVSEMLTTYDIAQGTLQRGEEAQAQLLKLPPIVHQYGGEQVEGPLRISKAMHEMGHRLEGQAAALKHSITREVDREMERDRSAAKSTLTQVAADHVPHSGVNYAVRNGGVKDTTHRS